MAATTTQKSFTSEHSTSRKVPMKVLNLSFSKNGTVSTAAALTRLLEGPIMHGRDMSTDPRVSGRFFLPPLRHKYNLPGGRAYTRADWDAGLGNYVGACDIAVTYLWRELMDAYPEAKVVIVQRPIEKWYVSWRDNIVDGGLYHPIASVIIWLEKWFEMTGAATFCRIGTIKYFEADTRDQILARARDVYVEHYESVKEKCRREGRELLEYRLGDGWEPVATFFGLPIPDEPFPHLNEKEEMRKHMRETMHRDLRRGLKMLSYYVLPVVVVLVAFTWRR